MELTPVGIIILGVWALAFTRGVGMAGALAIALIPFGTAAVINLPAMGDLSILGAQVAAALTTGVALLFFLSSGRASDNVRIGAPMALLIALCAYGAATAFFVPRLFHGAFDVVPLARGMLGVPVNDLTLTSVIPLEPQSSNISQPAYLIGSCAFFATAAWITQIRGMRFTHRAIIAAALVNVVLAALDIAGLDSVLTFFRTANYRVIAGAEITGMRRVIGGFSEASAFGETTTALFAYFASIAIDRRKPLMIVVALLCAALSLASLSSTAIFGFAITFGYLGLRMVSDFAGNRMTSSPFMSGGFIGALALIGLIALIALTPLKDRIFDVIDDLILQKTSSRSGIERAIWADYGFRAFRDTFGIGAGLGSIRGNGLASVMLGNIGLPGALIFAAFIWQVFVRPLPRLALPIAGSRETRAYFRASFAAAVTMLATSTASTTILDPGILFFTFAALAATSRAALEGWARQARTGDWGGSQVMTVRHS